jgi:hypothetical protein
MTGNRTHLRLVYSRSRVEADLQLSETEAEIMSLIPCSIALFSDRIDVPTLYNSCLDRGISAGHYLKGFGRLISLGCVHCLGDLSFRLCKKGITYLQKQSKQ